MPRDYHREFSLTAGSSCTINKGDAEASLSSQTSAHCVFPGETNLCCYFPLLSIPSMSQAMSNYHSYLSFSPKRRYYIRQNMHRISVLVMYYFPLSLSTWAFTKSVLSAVPWLTTLYVNANFHWKFTEVAFGVSWCFFTTFRIHLLFEFLLFLGTLSVYLI